MPSQWTTLTLSSFSAIAFYQLWILMWQNGTVDALEAAVNAGRFADGTPLQTSYTGLGSVDHVLSTLVAFTYYVTRGTNQAEWLLMVDIVSSLQTALLWCLVDSLREEGSVIWLAMQVEPAIWGLLWNGFGAGFILPLYYLVHLHYPPKARGLPLRHSKSLVASIIAGAYLPAAAMLSMPFFPRSIARQQNIIVLVQLSPVLTTIIQHLLTRISGTLLPESASATAADVKTLRRSYLLIGMVPALCHICVVGRALSTTGLASMYIPGPNSQVTAATLDKVAQGAFLFLQYDWIMINASTLIWSFSKINAVADLDAITLAASLLVVECVVGPGALVCGILWWSEKRLADAFNG